MHSKQTQYAIIKKIDGRECENRRSGTDKYSAGPTKNCRLFYSDYIKIGRTDKILGLSVRRTDTDLVVFEFSEMDQTAWHNAQL